MKGIEIDSDKDDPLGLGEYKTTHGAYPVTHHRSEPLARKSHTTSYRRLDRTHRQLEPEALPVVVRNIVQTERTSKDHKRLILIGWCITFLGPPVTYLILMSLCDLFNVRPNVGGIIGISAFIALIGMAVSGVANAWAWWNHG